MTTGALLRHQHQHRTGQAVRGPREDNHQASKDSTTRATESTNAGFKGHSQTLKSTTLPARARFGLFANPPTTSGGGAQAAGADKTRSSRCAA